MQLELLRVWVVLCGLSFPVSAIIVLQCFHFLRGWTSAFLLDVHRLRGSIGRLSHFLPRWLRMGWLSAISQGNPVKYSAMAGN